MKKLFMLVQAMVIACFVISCGHNPKGSSSSAPSAPKVYPDTHRVVKNGFPKNCVNECSQAGPYCFDWPVKDSDINGNIKELYARATSLKPHQEFDFDLGPSTFLAKIETFQVGPFKISLSRSNGEFQRKTADDITLYTDIDDPISLSVDDPGLNSDLGGLLLRVEFENQTPIFVTTNGCLLFTTWPQ